MAPKRKAQAEEDVEPREARPSRAAKAVRTVSDDKATKEKTTRTRSKKEARICFAFLFEFQPFDLCIQPLPSKEKFTEGALPLHVQITHTPPPIDQVAASEANDPGFLGHILLIPRRLCF